jgi:putative tricarboxylic transport membrane protein
MWDVGLMLGFGGIGYVMRKLEYSPAALVSGLVLGPLAENAFRQSLQISDGSHAIFFTRPLAAVLMLTAGMAVAWPLVSVLVRARGR